jgi:hypothetical protein
VFARPLRELEPRCPAVRVRGVEPARHHQVRVEVPNLIFECAYVDGPHLDAQPKPPDGALYSVAVDAVALFLGDEDPHLAYPYHSLLSLLTAARTSAKVDALERTSLAPASRNSS